MPELRNNGRRSAVGEQRTMRTTCLLAFACDVAVTACQRDASHPAATAFRFVAQPCDAALQAPSVTCGTVAVPEDYAKPQGRTIDLHVIDFHALEPGSEKAAQFDLEGGPGFAVTDSAVFYATDGEAYRQHRDVVLFDMRGTGASNPIRCTALEERQKAQPAAPIYPPELVAECAERLSATVDLRQYTTANASRDIDAVRQALGFEQIDLNALSYGTTLALRYIADHPTRVRTAVLTSTVPAGKTPPAHHAIAAENGLGHLFDACAADAACAAQYPALASDLDRALRQLDPDRRGVFMEKLRATLYLPGTARRAPSIVHAAAQGNVEILDRSSGPGRAFSDGVYLSITCSESLARIDADKAIAEADATRFGSYRVRRQRDACERWPAAAPDPDLFRTGRYDVPVLFLSGALDPVSPTDWTRETAVQFPDSRHVIVPQGGHVLEGLSGMDSCIDAMILAFVASRSLAGIDDSCVADMSAGPFLVP
jgi:pimeloyl-ACP methyl ester carboxylesterase